MCLFQRFCHFRKRSEDDRLTDERPYRDRSAPAPLTSPPDCGAHYAHYRSPFAFSRFSLASSPARSAGCKRDLRSLPARSEPRYGRSPSPACAGAFCRVGATINETAAHGSCQSSAISRFSARRALRARLSPNLAVADPFTHCSRSSDSRSSTAGPPHANRAVNGSLRSPFTSRFSFDGSLRSPSHSEPRTRRNFERPL
jgi:hypothetical protein